uniref:uncharacterized protein LOC120347219 n=1 Tax=Styela clava TaxID=7725 RepID=UPI00193A37BC|nr:uncharacterized protein LOC120347219 [Styela clava]
MSAMGSSVVLRQGGAKIDKLQKESNFRTSRRPLRPLLKRASSTSICDLRDFNMSKQRVMESQCSQKSSDDSDISQDSSAHNYKKNQQMRGFLIDFVSPQSPACSGSSSSSCSCSGGSSPIDEDEIVPVQTICEESSFQFNAQLRHPTTDFKWCVSSLREGGGIKVDISAGMYNLYGWKIGSGNVYVFGYEDSNGVYYYVKCPENGNSSPYLTLSSAYPHPSQISDPTTDHRCISYVGDPSSRQYYLHPTHNLSQVIDYMSNGYLCVKTSSVRLAKAWSLSQ